MIVAVAVGLALLIQAFVAKPYRIPSESMLQTLKIGQRILVNRLDNHFGSPQRGDILVFDPPGGADGDPECALQDGDRFGAGRVYRDGSEEVSDVKMVCPLPAPGRTDEAYVKRVVGLPGERIAIERGRVLINGRRIDEPYVDPGNDCADQRAIESDCNFPTEVEIPPGHYFMMGDNRDDGASYDSRFWGPVKAENMIGEVVFSYWPPTRIGTP